MTDEMRTTPLTRAPSRLSKQVRRLALVLTLALTALGASSLVAPATHAACPPGGCGGGPSITATNGNFSIYVKGSGFTPYGSVTVYVYNSSYSSAMTFGTTGSPVSCIFLGNCGGGGTIGVSTSGFCSQTNHLIAKDNVSGKWSNWSSAVLFCIQ